MLVLAHIVPDVVLCHTAIALAAALGGPRRGAVPLRHAPSPEVQLIVVSERESCGDIRLRLVSPNPLCRLPRPLCRLFDCRLACRLLDLKLSRRKVDFPSRVLVTPLPAPSESDITMVSQVWATGPLDRLPPTGVASGCHLPQRLYGARKFCGHLLPHLTHLGRALEAGVSFFSSWLNLLSCSRLVDY